MAGIDEHVTEAIAGLPINDGDGIPWFAITEPDGRVMAISRRAAGQHRLSRLRGGNPSISADARDGTVRKITSDEVAGVVDFALIGSVRRFAPLPATDHAPIPVEALEFLRIEQ